MHIIKRIIWGFREIMSKKIINNTASNRTGSKNTRRVRVAYSLNNYQPVACTIISDQPFFYMDEDILIEEEGILSEENFSEFASDFSDENYDFLESELVNIRTKIDAYERLSLEFAKPADLSLQQFIMDSHYIGEKATAQNKTTTIEKITEAISKSRMASSLLELANEHKVELVCSNQINTASYDKKANKILIRNDIDFVDQVLLTVQELRRHWQHRQGVLVHPLAFHPDQAVLINRAQLADLSVSIVRCAWEMKLQGLKEIWARIENSCLSDLGRALAREAYTDFRTLNNGQASAAVFETWFLSERCRAQDKKLIQAMLADYRGYVFDNAEASRMVSIDLICALGSQPFGKNYLAPYAQMIMNDPVFTDVRDRSNANFLWFIKFERSFQETEQELQSSDVTNKSGPISFEDRAENNDIIEDNQHEGQYDSRAKESLHSSIFGEQATQDGNNVIHVQFGVDGSSCEGILS